MRFNSEFKGLISSPGGFIPAKNSASPSIAGWVGHTDGLEVLKKREIS
jgi:hypothetical protein